MKNYQKKNIKKYSIILSIYICYYIRIFRKDYRQELKTINE